MFTRQAPGLHNALLQGGVAPPQASQAQNLLGQCRAPLVHRGPISIDSTTPDMRLIDPATARARFPGIEDLGREPEDIEEEEEEDDLPPGTPGRPPSPPTGLPPPTSFPAPPAPPQRAITAGDYITVVGNEVSLKHNDFADGRNCTFQNGVVRGVSLDTRDISRTLRGDQLPDYHIEASWDEQPNQTVLRYGIKNLRQFRVVTGVEFFPDGVPDEYGTPGQPGIRVTYESIRAWPGDGGQTFSVIPVSECPDDSSYPRGSAPEAEEESDADPVG
jgi:hypothetical protein